MDTDPPDNQDLVTPIRYDYWGRKELPGMWEYAWNLGNHPDCVWDPKGPGEFLFRPKFHDAIDMIRVEYKFESGAHAQLIENDAGRKAYELYAPGGQIDLPTSAEHKTWTWRLPANTRLRSELFAWRRDLVALANSRPKKIDRETIPAAVAKLAEHRERTRERLREVHRKNRFNLEPSDEEFERWLDLHHPSIEVTPEECERQYQALKAHFGLSD